MTVDRISSGRLELGIGAAASAYDWTMTSGAAPWLQTERVARFTEAVEIVDGLLRGTLGSYAGQYYQIAEAALAPGPVQQSRPRLVIAAGGPRMVKLAARYADAWVTEGAYRELWGTRTTLADVERITRERAALLSEEASELGRIRRPSAGSSWPASRRVPRRRGPLSVPSKIWSGDLANRASMNSFSLSRTQASGGSLSERWRFVARLGIRRSPA